jgi:cobalamin synthase
MGHLKGKIEGYERAAWIIPLACILVGGVLGPLFYIKNGIGGESKILDKLLLAGVLALAVDMWMHKVNRQIC